MSGGSTRQLGREERVGEPREGVARPARGSEVVLIAGNAAV
jgi:hypothetical protein